MRLHSLCLSLVAASISAQSFASFELMLLPNAGTNRVTRFDPELGLSLGQFGFFGATGSGPFVNYQSPGTAFISTSTGTTRFNFSTGTSDGHVDFPDSLVRISPDGGALFGAFSTELDRRTSDLVSFSSFSSGLVSGITAIAPHSSTIAAVFGESAGALVYQRFSGSTFGAVTSVTTVPNYIPGSLGQGVATVSGGVSTTLMPYRFGSGSVQMLRVMSTSSATTFSSFTLNSASNFGLTAILNVLPAHHGYYVVGDDATSPTLTRISHYSAGSVLLSSYTTSAVDVPTTSWGGAIVLTPEPGSFAVLGLGLVALMRRRSAK